MMESTCMYYTAPVWLSWAVENIIPSGKLNNEGLLTQRKVFTVKYETDTVNQPIRMQGSRE